MSRFVSLRLLAPLAVLIGTGALALDRLPSPAGAPQVAAAPAAVTAAAGQPATATRISARASAANPAWGSSGVGYRYAFDGKCDDPRFVVTTGAADPGSDDYDCARFGGGLKK